MLNVVGPCHSQEDRIYVKEHGYINTESQLQKAISEAAYEAYYLINKNWKLIHPWEKPSTTSPYWEPRDDIEPTMLFIKKGWERHLAHALHDLFNSPTRYQRNVFEFVQPWVALKLLGGESIYSEALIEQITTGQKRFKDLCILADIAIYFVDLFPNSPMNVRFVKFRNIPEYAIFKPRGEAKLLEVVQLEDRKFIGFGPRFFTTPRTYDELEHLMYAWFISRDNVEPSLKEQHATFCKTLNLVTFKQKRREHKSSDIFGGLLVRMFDLTKIQDFRNRTPIRTKKLL